MSKRKKVCKERERALSFCIVWTLKYSKVGVGCYYATVVYFFLPFAVVGNIIFAFITQSRHLSIFPGLKLRRILSICNDELGFRSLWFLLLRSLANPHILYSKG